MTGFARATGEEGSYSWAWEAKSVNARGLDVRVRLPQRFEGYESAVRTTTSQHFKRGSVTLALTLEKGDVQASLRINEGLLQQILALQRSLEGKVSDEPPRLDMLLQLRGLVEVADEQDDGGDELWLTVLAVSLDEVLGALHNSRVREGERLSGFVRELIDRIETLCEEAVRTAAVQPAAIKARLATQIAELLGDVSALPEERLAHEVALLAVRADLREELDRLTAHVAAARDLLSAAGPIGRQLDFLCQEFNREANTLCSKSSDIDLTRIGLELKTAVDQMREQVQNIE